MKNRKLIKGADVVLPDSCKKCSVLIANGKIAAILPENSAADAEIINADGMYMLPGFVEIHAHGGGGFDFADGTEEAFKAVCGAHLSHGTTSVAPTLVSMSDESMYRFFDIYRAMKPKIGINLLGIHLEGPFISPEMKGAQNPAYIHSPDKREVDRLADTAGDIISLCTAAPETSGAEYMAKRMKECGSVLSIGHSNATCAQAKKGFDMGFSHITHLYSNTPGVRKINQVVCAGLLEAAYLYDFDIELIGDGHHVAKEVLALALKVKGADKINLTSDAMRAAGTDAAESYLGEIAPENRVIIEDGVAKLPDRSFFAGSIATGDIMLKWAVRDCGVHVCDASKMLSATPARIIGAKKKGSIVCGYDADLILTDKEFNVNKIFVNGVER